MIGDFVKKLQNVGYENGYANGITVVATVKKGYKGEFPVRDINRQKKLKQKKLRKAVALCLNTPMDLHLEALFLIFAWYRVSMIAV